jgi:hypothetical protein
MGDNVFFPNIDDFESKQESYEMYKQIHGDMGNSRMFNFDHGEWIVVGHGEKTNHKCGVFRRWDGCLRAELHGQNKLGEESHKGKAFIHKVHNWCNNYRCPICYLYGACLREAEHATQRIMFASKGGKDDLGRYHAPLGEPQHIIVSPPKCDWDLAEFEHEKFCKKVRSIIRAVGIESCGMIFHGFRYASYEESLEKGVLYGYYWSPHFHLIGFIVGGYGTCRHCSKTARTYRTRGNKIVTKHGDKRFCDGCDGFEHRVRESFEKNGYIISNTDERKSVFSTVWYQLSHMAIKKGVVKV